MGQDDISNQQPEPLEEPEDRPLTYPLILGAEEQKFEVEQIDKGLRKKLDEAGIKIEIVDILLFPTEYNGKDKILKIRQNAVVEEVNDYIERYILPTPEYQDSLKSGKIAPTLEPASISQKEDIHEWKRGEEWGEFKRLRIKKASAENDFRKRKISQEDLDRVKADYENARNSVANKIREAIKKEAGWMEGDTFPAEEQAVLNSKINDILFEELVRRENDAYLSALREAREETLGDKVKEGLRMVLGLRAVNWYLKQNKWTRAAINTGLFAAAVGVGTFVGGGAASVALGATIYRGARATGSILGSGGGIVADKKLFKQIETVDKEEKEEIEKIKSDENLSLEEKSKRFNEVKERFDKERKWITKRKVAMMVSGGIIAGSAVGGLLDYAYGGSRIQANRVPRGTMDLTHKSGTENLTSTPRIQLASEVSTPNPPAPLESAAPKPATPEPAKILPNLREVFKNPENLEHIKMEGNNNSIWKAIEKGFDENEEFKNLNRAQKDNVIAFFTGKAIDDPAKYGFTSDPDFGVKIEPNQEVNLSKLLGNPEEIKKILKGASDLTENKQKNILENRVRIAAYLQEHPDTELTSDKVAEILSGKPEGEVISKPVAEPMPIHSSPSEPEKPLVEDQTKIQKETIEQEIRDAKERLLKLEGEKIADTQPIRPLPEKFESNEGVLGEVNGQTNETLTRAVSGEANSGMRTMLSDSEFANKIEMAFRNEVGNIYSKRGALGFRRIEGIDTAEWKFMGKLPANKVMEYATNNSSTSGLAPKIVQEISGSPKHQRLIEQMVGLAEKTNGAVRPFEREDVERFLKRLGGYVLKAHLHKTA